MGLDYTPMPEGHVIHRLAQHLNREFTDTSPIVTSPQGRFDAQARTLDGQPYLESDAYGKHLFIEFDVSQPERIIYIHLGLIGSLHFEDPEETKGQIRLHMATDTIAANLRGPQWCRLITAEEKAVAVDKLGADPLRADADPKPIKEKVNKSNRSIASLLMDQSLFPGVGNIYRAETLFRLGIDPFSSGKDADFDAIWADLVQLMAEGVKAGRIDTVRPKHTPEAMNRPPRVDDHGGEVYVYRRAGQKCYICGTPISEQVMEGRNLFWCPTCQKGD